MFDNHSPAENPAKVFIGNLAFTATQEQIEELFGQHGTLVDVKVVFDRMSGRPKGIAFVEFSSPEEAQAAIAALNGFEFLGRPLMVNIARPPAPRTGGFGGGSRPSGGFRGGNDNYRGGNSRGGGRDGGYRGGNRGGYND